jgi:predicted 2-oxoglutarate/Fe(II)-dependent dioxygenase YbiX
MNIQLEQPFKLFTEAQCSSLILRAQQLELKQGQVMSNDPMRQRRNNHAYWLALEDNEYDQLWELVRPWHQELNLTWMQKPIQISRYHTGEFYDWHPDSYSHDHRKSVRALTLTCTLQTAPGAVFETRNGSYDLEQGHAILFPAELEHRACAPTVGERWALTVWYMRPNLDIVRQVV